MVQRHTYEPRRRDELAAQVQEQVAGVISDSQKAASDAAAAKQQTDSVVQQVTSDLQSMRTEIENYIASANSDRQDAAARLTKDVQERLLVIESAMRRSVEEEVSSLKALSQANIAAEAAIRLREDLLGFFY